LATFGLPASSGQGAKDKQGVSAFMDNNVASKLARCGAIKDKARGQSSTPKPGETETQVKETKPEREAKKNKKTSQGDTGQTPEKNKDRSMEKTTLVISDSPKGTSSKASEKKPQTRAEESLVVPNSPENGLVEEPRLSPKASPKSKPPSRLAKLRQAAVIQLTSASFFIIISDSDYQGVCLLTQK
ncbi:uncharacterized protein LOC124288050, partial [Haliotis rubra]|uniref:uncharacterized protein LOC124288050 n=1 Tax=Haliotis rubra TaxID=36100 RepID=UPI001EE5F5D1